MAMQAVAERNTTNQSESTTTSEEDSFGPQTISKLEVKETPSNYCVFQSVFIQRVMGYQVVMLRS